MNIQNFFRPVKKLIDSDCEVDGECSEDEAFQNIYQPTASDNEFIASSDDDESGGKQGFLDFVQDEQDARRWREHCAAQKKNKQQQHSSLPTGKRHLPPSEPPFSKQPRNVSAPKPLPPPKPHFIKPGPVRPVVTSGLQATAIPTFLIRTRKRRFWRKRKKTLPLLVTGKKKRKKDHAPPNTAMFYPAKTKGHRRHAVHKKGCQDVRKKKQKGAWSPEPYRPFDMDEDPYFGETNGNFSEEEDVGAVATNFHLLSSK